MTDKVEIYAEQLLLINKYFPLTDLYRVWIATMGDDKQFAIFWLKQIKEKYIHGGDEEFDSCRKRAIDIAIKELEKPKVGKWVTVMHLPQNKEFKRCTCCDDVCMGWDGETGIAYAYCPNCGAKMD